MLQLSSDCGLALVSGFLVIVLQAGDLLSVAYR